jgi:pantoate--beta-alanine ligase
MAVDLTFGIELKGLPTVRESDGLALSSRNARLSEEDRKKAPKVYQSLLLARDNLLEAKSVKETKSIVENFCSEIDRLTLEYFEVADEETLIPVDTVVKNKEYALCIAAWLGNVRLIDNIIVNI